MFRKCFIHAAFLSFAVLPLPHHQTALAADHIDSPRVREANTAAIDITDLFAFRSPSDPSRIVLAMNFFTPVGNPDSAQLFQSSDQADYVFYIDTDGDNRADQKIRARFSADSGGEQTYTIEGIPGVGAITGNVTSAGEAAKVTELDGASAFAGLRDDPFFFDFEAYNAFLSAPCIPAAGLRCPGTGDPTDFFLGLNVAAIVVEFPVSSLPGISADNSGSVGVWAKTFVK